MYALVMFSWNEMETATLNLFTSLQARELDGSVVSEAVLLRVGEQIPRSI